ncbi:MAG TPA: hypothetical protein VJI67_03255 [archaeon]|nr:hypothetical protein [archaeon]HLD81417.1 hypothetical protein [archaeon]
MISLEDVMKARRLEQSATRLVKMEKNFYEQLKEFIREQKRRTTEEFSIEKAKEFENLKNAVTDLYNLREKKIVTQAVRSARTGSSDKEHLQGFESQLLEEISNTIKKGREELNGLFGEGTSSVSLAEKRHLNKVGLVILQDLPAFIGTDLKEYGPFKRDEKTELPREVAELLVSSQKAKSE